MFLGNEAHAKILDKPVNKIKIREFQKKIKKVKEGHLRIFLHKAIFLFIRTVDGRPEQGLISIDMLNFQPELVHLSFPITSSL